MDYDDNDFHSWNLHLDGEGNRKHPSVLQPYALPKFDFDDSLQGHLRFDSLVETEVFLGIENNESNHWIGDFVRGSTGIEFSSSVAGACSISRCNNVCSGATSSESVEMLLKSVGQEEVIPSGTVIENLDACDELRCLIKQMEPRLKIDDNILSKVQDVTDLQSTLVDEVPRDFSAHPHVEESIQTHPCDLHVDGSSNDLEPSTVSENCGLSISEGTTFGDRKLDDEYRREDDTSAIEHPVDKLQEDSFVSGMQVETLVTSVHGLDMRSSELNYEGLQHQVNDVCEGSPYFHVSREELEMDKQNVDRDIVFNYTSQDEKPDCLASKAETIVELSAIETSIINAEESRSDMSKDHPEQHQVECSTGEFSRVSAEIHKCEDVILDKGSDFGSNQPSKVSKQELSPVTFGGDSQVEKHVLKFSITSAENPSGLDQAMENFVKARHEETRNEEEVLVSGQSLKNEISFGKSEANFPSVEDYKVCKGEGNRISNSHEGVISSLTIAKFPPDMHCEDVAGNLKVVHDASEVFQEILSEAVRKSDQTKTCLDVGVHNKDGSVSDIESARFSDDHSNDDGKVGESLDKGVSSSHFDEALKDESLVSNLHISTATASELVIDVTLENSKFLSCDAISLPSKNGLKMDADPKEDQMTSSTSLGSSQLDRTDKAATKEPSLSSPFESSQSLPGQRPVSEAEAETQEASQEKETIEVKDQETKETSECPVSRESTEKHGDVKEAKGFSQSPIIVTVDKCIRIKLEESSEMKTKNDTTHIQTRSLLLEETHCTAAQKIEEGNKEMKTKKDTKHTQPWPLLLEETHCTVAQKIEGNKAILDSKYENSGQNIELKDNKMRNNDTTHTQPGPLLLEETRCTAAQKIEQGNAPEIRAGSFHSVSLPETHGKSSSQEDLSGSADCNELVCGSSELPVGTHGKVDTKVSTNHKAPVANVVDGVANHMSLNTHEPKENDASKDKRSGNVDVSSIVELPKGDAGNNGKSFSDVPAPKVAQKSPSGCGLGRSEPKTTTHNISQASPLAFDGKTVCDRAKGTPEIKRRRSFAKAAGKDKKGIQVNEITPVKQSGRPDKFNNVTPSSSGFFQHVKSNETQHYGHVKGSNTKPYFIVATATSGLPKLNASGSQSALFQQSFTDFQQVQLRAQIFVYGALIQGIAPEEAYMVSAFDGPDGGRSMWENVWRTCIERLRGQKSSAFDPEIPLHPRSGTKASDQVTKQNSLQSKDTTGHSSIKCTQAIISPMIPLSSPLWSVSTPGGDTLKCSVMPRGSVSNYQHSLSPLYPIQTPPMRSFLGHNASCIPQASLRGPWVSLPQSSVAETSIHISLFPSTEAVQLNPVKETSTPNPSATNLVFSGPIVHTGDQRSGLAGTTSVLDSKKMLPSSGRQSIDSKPRKRKKNLVADEHDQIFLQPVSQPEPVVTSSFPLAVSITTLAPTPFVSKAMSEILISPASPASSYDHLKRVGHDSVYRSNLPEETLGKIKETRKQAKDANALAATAVGHCQEIWNQLDKNKNSGLSSDVEAKLASAAVQVAAAAAVAKAAAAAANVALSAALQAKLMADEAMISIIGGVSSGRPGTFSDKVNGMATPASISRSDDGTNSSSSMIMAARVAAWRRVEDASAASKRAENMDAIVKAAELAAEAVSQAGKIVAMGDPLPLSKLVEAGPQGYWRVPQLSSGPVTKSTDIIRDQPKGAAGEVGDISMKNSKGRQSSRKETHTIVNEKSQSVMNVVKEPIDDHLRLMDVPSGSLVEERQSRQIGHNYSDLSKNISVVLESGIGSELSPIVVENELEKATETSKRNSIKEGSQVEVFKDGDGCKAAWFTAKVLSVKDGKAFVSYPEIYLDQGSGEQVKEWVELASEGDEAPKIRVARPITTVQFKGTRKRRRAAMGDHTWSVGDRIDAWITDSWWEGVITEKNKKDETSLTVHFPAQGVTSVVKAWHIRSSLTWKDGHWIEWSNLGKDSSLEGDMPQVKRPKLGSPAVDAKGNDTTSKNNDNVYSENLKETRSLDLSSTERVFKIGKNTRTMNKPDGTSTVRTGLQEGSRVKVGVPKPGKKRKFMKVSKHFVSDRATKTNEAIDSAKPCLMPHRQGLHVLKNTTKIDSKEKQVADSKLKSLKSGKQQGISGRSIPLKDNFPTNAISAGTVKDRTRTKDSTQLGTTSGKNESTGTGSFTTTEGTAENPIVFSSSAPTSDAPSKRVSSGKTDRTNKGNLAPARQKLGKIEEDNVSNGGPVKSTSGVVEPRRSNRRIQPTSRLLEGLQSSLIISKIPFSHDRGHRSQSRNTSKRE